MIVCVNISAIGTKNIISENCLFFVVVNFVGTAFNLVSLFYFIRAKIKFLINASHLHLSLIEDSCKKTKYSLHEDGRVKKI